MKARIGCQRSSIPGSIRGWAALAAAHRPRSRILLGALAAALFVTASAGGVRGQGLRTAPPPVRSTVDANGVDLVTGALTVTTPEVSVGQGEGALTYARVLIGAGWSDNITGTLAISGATYTVSFGGSSESFTLSGGVFTNA